MKPSQPLLARLRLTTKQINGGYYKGNRTGSMGFFLKSSTYVIDPRKLRTYVVPENLEDFKLTPFVTKSFLPTRSSYTTEVVQDGVTSNTPRAFNGEDYLQLWEQLNPREYDEWADKWKTKRYNLNNKQKAEQEQVMQLDKRNQAKRKLKGGRTQASQMRNRKAL